jgi:hypothetical protein
MAAQDINIPGSDFRKSYSNLIKAIWKDSSVADEVEKDPSKLKDFGFTDVPKSVKITHANGGVSLQGFQDQLKEWQQGGDVEFHIPEKPSATTGSELDTSYCCCCCPCCTCT